MASLGGGQWLCLMQSHPFIMECGGSFQGEGRIDTSSQVQIIALFGLSPVFVCHAHYEICSHSAPPPPTYLGRPNPTAMVLFYPECTSQHSSLCTPVYDTKLADALWMVVSLPK